jgi:hypothetical protein
MMAWRFEIAVDCCVPVFAGRTGLTGFQGRGAVPEVAVFREHWQCAHALLFKHLVLIEIKPS